MRMSSGMRRPGEWTVGSDGLNSWWICLQREARDQAVVAPGRRPRGSSIAADVEVGVTLADQTSSLEESGTSISFTSRADAEDTGLGVAVEPHISETSRATRALITRSRRRLSGNADVRNLIHVEVPPGRPSLAVSKLSRLAPDDGAGGSSLD